MTTYTNINMDELDALIKRLEEADKYHFVLEPKDTQLIISALITLANLQQNLVSKNITITKMKKLVGMVASSEKSQRLVGENESKSSKPKSPPKQPKPKSKPVKATVIIHALTEHKKGDNCPGCECGKVYKYEPATFLRITGQTPYTPEQHVLERLRCNACGEYFTAEISEEIKADGESHQKYGYSARSLIAISKYYAGTPFYRQESLQHILGVPMSASTQFDQIEYLVNDISPVFECLKKKAADADFYWVDDTSHRIIKAKPIMKKSRRTGKKKERKGVYSSGLIALLKKKQYIVLFETNIGHAGEFFDSIYINRNTDLPAAVLMSDALTSNRPSDKKVIMSLCNSHARRQFYDIWSYFTEEVDSLIADYSQIWHFDKQTRSMTKQQRLSYHQQYSLPFMEKIFAYCTSKLASGDVEGNSALGNAMKYFIKHYDGLTKFCYVLGAAIDNNRMEAEIKLVVRDRKNAFFHQTLFGATVGDIITSMIATASWCGCNVFDYFNTLQREKEKVKLNPELYLPWNYLEQI